MYILYKLTGLQVVHYYKGRKKFHQGGFEKILDSYSTLNSVFNDTKIFWVCQLFGLQQLDYNQFKVH